MTTAETVAALSTEVSHIKSDVAEIKTDVKSLVATQTQLAINLATRDAVEAANSRSRASTGVWLRFFSERFLSILALVVSIAVLIRG